MKNHFIIAYYGNKHNEVEVIEFLESSLYDDLVIVEPFCGTSALSFLLSQKHPCKFSYVLNDANPLLMQLYDTMKDETTFLSFEKNINKIIEGINTKEEYRKFVGHEDTLEKYFIAKFWYNYRAGLFNSKTKRKLNFNDSPFCKFLRNEKITLSCGDGNLVYDKYKDNDKCLMLLDPPYLLSCNDFYHSKDINIYEKLMKDEIQKLKAHIVLVVEDIWIIRLLFKDMIKQIYPKKYSVSHKKTNHVIISNR